MKRKKKVALKGQLAAGRALPRNRRVVFLLNEQEACLLEGYLKRHRIKNKSHWMRRTLLGAILKQVESDYPTLFNEHEMRR